MWGGDRRSWVRAVGVIWAAFHDNFLTSRKHISVVSSPAAVTYSWQFRRWSSGARTFLTDSWHGNLNFRWVIHFRFLSDFSFRSHVYIRDSDGTPPRVRDPRSEDHGRGRFYAILATYVTRTCRHRRRDQFNSQAARLETATRMAGCCDLRDLTTWFPWFSTNIRYLLDFE